jgi:hypothetical protein
MPPTPSFLPLSFSIRCGHDAWWLHLPGHGPRAPGRTLLAVGRGQPCAWLAVEDNPDSRDPLASLTLSPLSFSPVWPLTGGPLVPRVKAAHRANPLPFALDHRLVGPVSQHASAPMPALALCRIPAGPALSGPTYQPSCALVSRRSSPPPPRAAGPWASRVSLPRPACLHARPPFLISAIDLRSNSRGSLIPLHVIVLQKKPLVPWN